MRMEKEMDEEGKEGGKEREVRERRGESMREERSHPGIVLSLGVLSMLVCSFLGSNKRTGHSGQGGSHASHNNAGTKKSQIWLTGGI